MNQDQIKLLTQAYVGWEGMETGAPSIDPKRPYGNSSVTHDVAEILGWDVDANQGLTNEQDEQAMEIHRSTQAALQELINTLDKPEMQATLSALGVLNK